MNKKYLTVGYDRRNDDKKQNMVRTAEYDRHIMGRKGIGKLALFSIADTVEVQSVTEEGKHGFVMSAQKIKEQSRKEQNSREEVTPYHPDPLPDDKIMLEETSAIFAAVYTGFQTKTEKGRVQDVGFIFRS